MPAINVTTTDPVPKDNLDMQGYTLMDTLQKQTTLLIIASCIAGLFVVMIFVFVICKVRAYRSQKRALARRETRNLSRTAGRGSIHPHPTDGSPVGRASERRDGSRRDGRRDGNLRPEVERTRRRSIDNRNTPAGSHRSTIATSHAPYEDDGFYYNIRNMGNGSVTRGGAERQMGGAGGERPMLFS